MCDPGNHAASAPVKVPRVRPGIVVHEPALAVDGLLSRFATTLRERGFSVAGCVQLERGGADMGEGCAAWTRVVDLATGAMTAMAHDAMADPVLAATAASLRRAMRDGADLVVVSRFSTFHKAAGSLAATISPREQGVTLDMPVLTSIAGRCVHKWQNHMGPAGVMLAPDMVSLWHWWGAERLYQDLAFGVADDEIRQIALGPRWVLVEGPAGAGIAFLPKGPQGLMERLTMLNAMSLRRMAAFATSWDPSEMALGIAAINAHYNRYDLDGHMGTGIHSLREAGERVVVVGAFPGMAEILPNRMVIEPDPRPDEYPIAALDTLLPGCPAAVVASSNLVDRKLPRILRLAQGARIALTGPITPLSPRLHDYGVETLGGLLVRDPAGLGRAIRAGMPPRGFGRFGQYVHIRHSHPAQSRTQPCREPSP